MKNLTLEIEAEVRYWEDAMVNGEEDSEGSLIPFRSGDGWYPKINTETGEIIDWPEGVTADIHYKVCDAGEYFLSRGEKQIYKYKDYYVPDFLAPNRYGYGDYIILSVDGQGKIENWKFEFDESEWKKI